MYNKKNNNIHLQPFSMLMQGGLASGSPQQFPHFSCSCASSYFNPHSLISLSTTSSSHHPQLSSPPHSVRPSTTQNVLFFIQSPSYVRNTCPSHLNRFRFTMSDTDSIPILSSTWHCVPQRYTTHRLYHPHLCPLQSCTLLHVHGSCLASIHHHTCHNINIVVCNTCSTQFKPYSKVSDTHFDQLIRLPY